MQTAIESHRDLESMITDLNTIVKPEQTLATHDIGGMGYYGHFKVLDLVGLVNKDVLPYENGRKVRDYIEQAKPDYLLVFPAWDRLFLRIYPDDYPQQFEFVKLYEGGELRPEPYVLWRIKYP